jgi:hypothetical protein
MPAPDKMPVPAKPFHFIKSRFQKKRQVVYKAVSNNVMKKEARQNPRGQAKQKYSAKRVTNSREGFHSEKVLKIRGKTAYHKPG